MRLILIGDIHLYRLWTNPRHLLSKRLLGQFNLWFNRRRVFRRGRLPALVERAESLRADGLLCTGDLTTTAMRREFEMVIRMLGPLFARQPTYIVPGNHDRYTFSSARGRYLEEYLAEHIAETWPHHHVLGDRLHLIGLDAARPMWLRSSGRINSGQLDRLSELLKEIDPSHRLIMMGHYPPGTPPGVKEQGHHHRLTNADELVKLLAEAGHSTLMVHGHVHQPWCWRLREAPNVVAVNAGAPLMTSPDYPSGQGFWEIGIEAAHWRLTHHIPDDKGAWRTINVAVPENPGQVSVMV